MTDARRLDRPFRVAVLGTGYLGATHAACLTELGCDVLGVDTDATQAGALNAGRLPFWEPGLEFLLQRGRASGRLRFSTSYPQAAEFADVHFICVGTPQRPGRPEADLSQLAGTCVGAGALHKAAA